MTDRLIWITTALAVVAVACVAAIISYQHARTKRQWYKQHERWSRCYELCTASAEVSEQYPVNSASIRRRVRKIIGSEVA